MKSNLQLVEIQFKPEGITKSFLVRIPKPIVSAFQNLDDDEDRQILRSVIKILEAEKTKWATAKDQPIYDFIEAKRKFSASIAPQNTDILSFLSNAQAPSTDRRVKDAVLKIIKYFRILNDPNIKPLITNAVLMAIRENDHKFFMRFGRILEKRTLPYKAPKDLTPLQHLLTCHWFISDENELPFCCFTDQGLTDFLNIIASQTSTLDSVRKTRQLLKLRQTRRRLIKSAERRGDCIVLG